MGFEFQKAFQLETRRLLWLIAVVFGTIILFQRIELPTGNTLWPVFSLGKASEQKNNSFISENTTTNPILSGNMSSPGASNVSVVHELRDGIIKNDSSPRGNEDRDDPFSRDVPELIYPSENQTSESNSSSTEIHDNKFVALPPLQDANFSLALVEPPEALVEPPVASPMISSEGSILSGNSSLPHFSPSIPGETVKTNSSILSRNSSLPHSPSIPGETVKMNSSILSGNSRLPHLPSILGETVKTNSSILLGNSRLPHSPSIPGESAKTNSELHQKEVLTLSDMYELLVESHLTPYSMIPRWSMKVDGELVTAKSLIETEAPLDNELYAPLYNNASMFQRSYELMEKMLKVYIYQEGDKRIFHRPPLEGIYASEGWFMKLLEADRHFVTKRPEKAHLFYLPFSSRQLEETLYVRNSHSHKNLIQHLKNYLDLISRKYPFWNRTDGADHFLVACHDWAPSETKRHMSNCIRALCNADVKEGFNFGKDVSLPETYVRKAKNPLSDVGGKPASKRRTLAFYAGNMHGYLRPVLLEHWGNNKDPDMQIFGRLPSSKGNRNYIDYMKSSKYCICPRGYEVNSPRVVEAIFYECVPVIISDNFVPPFYETLNWESFAVFVAEKDVPNLKNILLSIPKKTFLRMHMRVKKVQQHFLWHPKPVKYDLFHMTLHSIWYNRVFQFKPR